MTLYDIGSKEKPFSPEGCGDLHDLLKKHGYENVGIEKPLPTIIELKGLAKLEKGCKAYGLDGRHLLVYGQLPESVIDEIQRLNYNISEHWDDISD